MNKLFNELNKALEENGFYDKCHYSMYGDDEDCRIDAFIEDFLLKHDAMNVKTNIIDAYDSLVYDCSVLSVAWIDAEGLHLDTTLIESF